MPRTIPVAMEAELEKGVFFPAFFVELHFRTGPVNVWSGRGDITWNTKTWSGLGQLGSISTIEDAAQVIANGLTVSCSGIDNTMLGDVLSEVQLGLPAIIYFGCFTSSGVLIPDPIGAWVGLMDQPQIDIGGKTSTIQIALENKLADMNTPVDRRYTTEDQQLDQVGDRAFDFVVGLISGVVSWGRTNYQQFNQQ